MESNAMTDMRKNRDKLSLKYSEMSIEQIKEEQSKSRSWFEKQMGKPLKKLKN